MSSSPYVVQFFDIFQDPAHPDVAPLIVTELAEGSSVRAAMRTLSVRTSPHTHYPARTTPNHLEMPIETIECIARSLANGLFYQHSRGYSHGDIKPLNLPLTHKFNPQTGLLPGTAWVKLGEFGLSRNLTRSATTPSTPRPRTLKWREPRILMLLVGRLCALKRTSDPRAGQSENSSRKRHAARSDQVVPVTWRFKPAEEICYMVILEDKQPMRTRNTQCLRYVRHAKLRVAASRGDRLCNGHHEITEACTIYMLRGKNFN
jgi:serine/threonine protein kinase